MVWVGWEKISRKDIKINSNLKSLEVAEFKSRSSEAGHSTIFLIVALVTILVSSSPGEALWLIILNMLLNVYPVLVQRYNRPRYQRVLQKMNVLLKDV